MSGWKQELIQANVVPKGLFAGVDEVVTPYLAGYGFAFHRDNETPKWHAARFYRKAQQYVKIDLNVNLRDGSPWGNVVLGVGDDAFPEADWNAIALWRIARRHGDPEAGTYHVDGWSLERFLTAAAADLERYARPFLLGDQAEFLKLRAEMNTDREPYRIGGRDAKGVWTWTPEPLSEALKKRFSKAE